MFTLTINTTSDAFQEDASGELARILRHLADDADAGLYFEKSPVFDANGNSVGHWEKV